MTTYEKLAEQWLSDENTELEILSILSAIRDFARYLDQQENKKEKIEELGEIDKIKDEEGNL